MGQTRQWIFKSTSERLNRFFEKYLYLKSVIYQHLPIHGYLVYITVLSLKYAINNQKHHRSGIPLLLKAFWRPQDMYVPLFCVRVQSR